MGERLRSLHSDENRVGALLFVNDRDGCPRATGSDKLSECDLPSCPLPLK